MLISFLLSILPCSLQETDSAIEKLNAARGISELTAAVRDTNPQPTFASFLKDVDFEFRTFQTNDGRATLGVKYDFAKSIFPPSDEFDKFKFALKFSGEGNVAFDSDVNPNDFLETGLELSLFKQRTDPVAYQNYLKKIAAEDVDPNDYEHSREWVRFKDAIRQALGREWLMSFTANAKYESNQDFSETQISYGLDGSFAISENDPESWLSAINFVDWPFRLMRWMFDTSDEEFSPGTAIPSVKFGIDMVDPTDNSVREALGEDDPFPRFRSQIEANSLVGIYEGKELRGRVGWRFFYE